MAAPALLGRDARRPAWRRRRSRGAWTWWPAPGCRARPASCSPARRRRRCRPPATSASTPFWNVTSTGSPTCRSRSFAGSLWTMMPPSTTASKLPSCRPTSTSCSKADRVDGADRLLVAVDRGLAAPRTAVTADELRHLGERLGDRRRQALERLVGDDVVGLDGVLEDLGERGAQRRGEHRRRADQGHADHQRRRRRRRAPRRPTGVLPGELARSPRTPWRSASRSAWSTGRATVDETLATPRKMSRPPPPASPSSPSVPPGRANRPMMNIAAPTSVTVTPSDEPPRAHRLEAELGTHRRDRRDLGRPAGRHDDRQHRDADPDQERHHDRPGQQHGAAVGEPGAGRVEDGDERPWRRGCRRRCRGSWR